MIVPREVGVHRCGYHWEAGTSFRQATAATVERKSETTAANIKGRYIRFLYKLVGDGEATFSIDVFTRNYS